MPAPCPTVCGAVASDSSIVQSGLLWCLLVMDCVCICARALRVKMGGGVRGLPQICRPLSTDGSAEQSRAERGVAADSGVRPPPHSCNEEHVCGEGLQPGWGACACRVLEPQPLGFPKQTRPLPSPPPLNCQRLLWGLGLWNPESWRTSLFSGTLVWFIFSALGFLRQILGCGLG